MTDLTWLAELIVTVLAIVISRYVVPWLRGKITESKNTELKFWTTLAVEAAEEHYKDLRGAGAKKLKEVSDFLAAKGYKLNDEEVLTLIDGIVRDKVNSGDYAE